MLGVVELLPAAALAGWLAGVRRLCLAVTLRRISALDFDFVSFHVLFSGDCGELTVGLDAAGVGMPWIGGMRFEFCLRKEVVGWCWRSIDNMGVGFSFGYANCGLIGL